MTILTKPKAKTRVLANYEKVVPRYDRTHARWLRDCGAEAQAALESAVRTRLVPGDHLLDVGCGTGAFARRLARDDGDSIHLTLADPCRGMLDLCDDFPACRFRAPLEDLPDADASQNIVTCAWAFELAADPSRAATELLRVLKPGGLLAMAFCARKPGESLTAKLWRHRIEARGMGAFLDPCEVAQQFESHPGITVRATPAAGPAAALLVFKAGF